MRRFFNKHPESVLIALAAIFIVVLGAYYFWGIIALVANLNKAINVGGGKQPQIEFNLKDAQGLGLEGLTK